MAELCSVCVCIGRLRIDASISWGSDDSEEPQPVLMARPDVIEVPELDDSDDDLRLGFKA